MKNITLLTICAPSFVLFSSGIIQRDSDKTLHIKLANEIQFNCVGQVMKVGLAHGSFVLISDSILLSVAHNFVQCKNPKMDSAIKLDLFTFILDSIEYTATTLVIHPAYFIDSFSTGHDLARIRLNKKVKNSIPAKLNKKFKELNEEAVKVWFGEFHKA
jgi:hypothetical protein